MSQNKLLKQSILLDQSCLLSYIGYSDPLAKIRLQEQVQEHVSDFRKIYENKLKKCSNLMQIKKEIEYIIKYGKDETLINT